MAIAEQGADDRSSCGKSEQGDNPLQTRNATLLALAAALLTLAAFDRVLAETPVNPKPNYTTIKVDDMHCLTCAKKIAARLYAVPGVVKVHADVDKNLAFVVPQKDKMPSPRAIWEAVEKAGFEPLLVSGPGGSFTKKPTR